LFAQKPSDVQTSPGAHSFVYVHASPSRRSLTRSTHVLCSSASSTQVCEVPQRRKRAVSSPWGSFGSHTVGWALRPPKKQPAKSSIASTRTSLMPSHRPRARNVAKNRRLAILLNEFLPHLADALNEAA